MLKTLQKKTILLDQYNKASDFHKKGDYVNADYIYEKLQYILDNSDSETEILVKTLLQRGKIAGLRKSNELRDLYLNKALATSKKLNHEKRLECMNMIYMAFADLFRMDLNKSKTKYYLRKANEIINQINDPTTQTVFYVNYGRALTNFREYNQAMRFFNIAQDIAQKNEINNLSPQIQESKANLYLSTHRYEEARIIFKKMIDDDVYSAPPYYYKALLYAKYSDNLQLTGNISESIEWYNKSLSITDKLKNEKVYLQLNIITASNKAYALEKIGDYHSATQIYQNNFIISQTNNFTDQIFHNLSNLIISLIKSNKIQVASKHLKELDSLLKNEIRYEVRYKYFLGLGLIHSAKLEFLKSITAFENGMKIALKSPSYSDDGYLRNAFPLIDSYIKIKEFSKAEDLALEAYKKTKKKTLKNFRFKAKIFKMKTVFFSKNNIESYITFLKHLERKKTVLNEEELWILKEEMQKNL